jgi:hypothetical protein
MCSLDLDKKREISTTGEISTEKAAVEDKNAG